MTKTNYTAHTLAFRLGVTLRKLTYQIYGVSSSAQFRVFNIPKKSGGIRVITAPIGFRSVLLQRLKTLLEEFYHPPPHVHGFVRGRSMITNAEGHVGARWLLNFDLDDFFGSIHFGRIYAILQSSAYGFNEKPARLIAHLACYQGVLPQGSPASPVIANMVARPLDNSLLRFCKDKRAYLTRYADDISISSSSMGSFTEFVEKVKTSWEFASNKTLSDSDFEVSNRLQRIVDSSGFSINPKKTHLQVLDSRKVVTGLVVNKRANVPRSFVKKNRAMLHSWYRYGYGEAETRFKKENYIDDEGSFVFQKCLKGRIDYLGQVKGRENRIYKKQYDEFYDLERRDQIKNVLTKKPKSMDRVLRETVWVVNVTYTDEQGLPSFVQGTAFHVGGGEFVTCDHIFWDVRGENEVPLIVELHKEGQEKDGVKAKILNYNAELDLAHLRIIKGDIEYAPVFGLEFDDSMEFQGRPTLTVAGFPSHGYGDELYIATGQHLQARKRHGILHHTISARIMSGNSGGPILNSSGFVVGVALFGVKEEEEEKEDKRNEVGTFNGFVSIRHAVEVFGLGGAG